MMFDELSRTFMDEIDSLEFFYKVQIPILTEIQEEGYKETALTTLAGIFLDMNDNPQFWDRIGIEKSIVCDHFEVSHKDDNGIKAVICKDNGQAIPVMQMRMALFDKKKYADVLTIHNSNTLIMLITRFESFLSKYFRCLYLQFPDYYLSNIQISYNELRSDNIYTLRERIVDREIDFLMRKNYAEWLKILGKHKIQVENKEGLENLAEVYARRNVWVHNSGKANETYLNQVKGCQYAVGDKLPIDDEYLKKAFRCIRIIMFSIMLESSKIVQPDSREKYLMGIFDMANQQINLGNYDIAKYAYFSLSQCTYLAEEDQNIAKVYYWVSCKEISGLASIKDDVENWDLSGLSDFFPTAKAALLDQFQGLSQLILKAIDSNELVIDYIIADVLYSSYRNSSEFREFKAQQTELFASSAI